MQQPNATAKAELAAKSCSNFVRQQSITFGVRGLRVYDETFGDVVSAKRTQSQLLSLGAAPTDAQMSARQEQHPSFVLLSGKKEAKAGGGGVRR